MSRLIKMTPEYMDECRADFEKTLRLSRLPDGRLNFTKKFSDIRRKAAVYFTASAWAKMFLLINEFDKEVAWHGAAYRVGEIESELPFAGPECAYIITDILVYPQEVSAASVEMDTEKYAVWLMDNSEDERFNNIRMQGHSHVKMAVSPSGVDLNHQEEILNMLGEKDFYIFMIWNKMFDRNIRIYDMEENTMFEDADITVHILDESGPLDGFLKNAKDMVEERAHCQQYNGACVQTVQPSTSYTQVNKTAGHGSITADPAFAKKEKPRTRIGDSSWYLRLIDGCTDKPTAIFHTGPNTI